MQCVSEDRSPRGILTFPESQQGLDVYWLKNRRLKRCSCLFHLLVREGVKSGPYTASFLKS